MTTLTTNTRVSTPYGVGYVHAPFAVQNDKGETVVRGVLVRLPIDDTTRKHLNRSNCVTPRATLSGLWVFQESELK